MWSVEWGRCGGPTPLASGPLMRAQLMRARLPDESGYVVNSGVRIHYGCTAPVSRRSAAAHVGDRGLPALEDAGAVPGPELPGDHFDPSGNGRSDRPEDPAAYADTASASDIAAVLDATGTERAVLVHTSEARLRGTAELETSSSGALMERARHSWQSAAPGLAPLVARRIALPASSVHPTTAGPPGARPVGVTR